MQAHLTGMHSLAAAWILERGSTSARSAKETIEICFSAHLTEGLKARWCNSSDRTDLGEPSLLIARGFPHASNVLERVCRQAASLVGLHRLCVCPCRLAAETEAAREEAVENARFLAPLRKYLEPFMEPPDYQSLPDTFKARRIHRSLYTSPEYSQVHPFLWTSTSIPTMLCICVRVLLATQIASHPHGA